MRLRAEQLQQHLGSGIAPLYVLSGEEPLQVQECRDVIRAAATDQGYLDRIVLSVETGFDWNVLRGYAASLSLFSEKRILDLRMPVPKPGKAGAEVLVAYAERPHPDNVLVISTAKADRATTASRWYKALEGAGVAVQTWPVDARSLPGWVRQRAKSRGLELDAEAAELLAERVEGNLLACAQEIEKLVMLRGTGTVDVQTVLATVADSARYGVFDLVDAALAGDADRSLRICRGLHEEGVEPTLVSWALAREVRACAPMAEELAAGAAMDAVLGRHRVWDRRKPLVGAALRRHRSPAWLEMLAAAADTDRIIKGSAPGRAWDELEALALRLCGLKIRSGKSYTAQ